MFFFSTLSTRTATATATTGGAASAGSEEQSDALPLCSHTPQAPLNGHVNESCSSSPNKNDNNNKYVKN